jgi:hypothetical protein
VDKSNLTLSTAFDTGEWHPRYWTLACVSTFHLILAATILTTAPKPPMPQIFNAVDVVTFPDGTTAVDQSQLPSEPVDLTQPKTPPVLPKPKVQIDPKFGPKATDKRVKSPPLPVPTPQAPTLPVPIPSEPITQTEAPVVAPKPIPLAPAQRSLPVPATEAVPTPAPRPAQMTPVLPTPAPVEMRATPVGPSLIQPTADPLKIDAQKLKTNQAPAIKPIGVREIPLPAPVPPSPVSPSPISPSPASPSVAPVAAPLPKLQPAAPSVRTPSPPPPAFVAPAPSPLAPSRNAPALPKVQVPRVSAADLRVPEVQAPSAGGPAASSAPPSTGVTSLSPPSSGAQTGGGGLPRPSGGGGAPSSGGAAGGPSGAAGSNTGALGSSGGANTGTAGGPTGVLPRRPGGASVREAFPRGDTSTVLGRMDKTYDCSRLNRERDARCPEWDPIEGRNSRGAAGFEVAVPKGLPKLRNPIGTNPLPICPPGTPGSQFGLSCLPTREGPGIPKQ